MYNILHINKAARASFAVASRTGSIQLILTYKEDKSRGFFLDLLLREVKVIAKNYALRILCVHQQQRDVMLLISNCRLNIKSDCTQVVFSSLKQKKAALSFLTLVSFIKTLEFCLFFFFLLKSFPVLQDKLLSSK